MRTELTIRLTPLGGSDPDGRKWWQVELPYGDPADRGWSEDKPYGWTPPGWEGLVRWPTDFRVRARTARGAKVALCAAIKALLDGNEDEDIEPRRFYAASDKWEAEND